MPFYLYAAKDVGGCTRYTRAGEIKPLAGSGPLTECAKKGMPATAPHKWHCSSADIMQEMGVDLSGHAVVIDLKPNVRSNVSLFLLRDIWGYSYEEWTPIAVLLQSLYTDLTHENPEHFKESFDDSDADLDLVGEFLYLHGGTKGGTWGWGRVGSVNAALLWVDAFCYLTGALAQHLAPGSRVSKP